MRMKEKGGKVIEKQRRNKRKLIILRKWERKETQVQKRQNEKDKSKKEKKGKTPKGQRKEREKVSRRS